MGFAKIKGKLRTRIGQRVRFGMPKDVGRKGGSVTYGAIVDEVWADPDINLSAPRQTSDANDWGDYSFCAQLIRWDSGEHQIRLAYYRRRANEDHWEFASQMTVTTNWKTIKSLMEKTLAKTDWFSDSPRVDDPNK